MQSYPPEKKFQRKGFVIHYQDGSIFSEVDGYWDNAPDKGIRELHYVLGDKVEVIRGYEQYFFSNEAVHGPSLSGRMGVWTAAIIGGVKGDEAIYKRITPDGGAETVFFPANRLMFDPKVYRKGVRD